MQDHMIIETSLRKRVLRDNFGWRITLHLRDISSTSKSFHICEQSYATNLSSSAVISCKLFMSACAAEITYY